jgi:hypothetical protein
MALPAVGTIRPWASLACTVMTEIGEGDLLIEERLPECLVLRMQEGLGFGFVFRAEALLFARLRVFAVEGAAALIQDEPLLHITFHSVMMNQSGDPPLLSRH